MNTEPLLYRLSPWDPAGHRFRVNLRIAQADPQGQVLSLPAWIPGSYLIRDFARQIETIAAYCNGEALAIEKIDNHSWRCAPCGGPLEIEYTVYAWDLSVRGAHFDETHAFFNGTSVFLRPAGLEDRPCVLELVAPDHAPDWTVHTSMRPASRHPGAAAPHGFGTYQAPDYDALVDHPVEMGRPQTIRFTAHGAEHELVFTGVVPNLDLERIARDAQKICAAQIELFEPETRRAPFLDSSDHYVFMTMVTGDGYGGLEHRSSTALHCARTDLPTIGGPDPGKGYVNFLGLLSHEYFHTWNVKRIKPSVFAPYDLLRENRTRLLWVFEGFTSYYDDLMLMRAGVIGEPEYFRLAAETISQVQRGVGRYKQSVAESSFDAWTRFYKQDENSPNALVSYYTKGALVAMGLDLLLRTETDNARSLDDVMRLLWQRYGRDFYQGARRGVDEEAMPELIREATGVDVSGFLRQYAYGCHDVPLERLFAAQGIRLSWKRDTAHPGLDARLRTSAGETTLATVYQGGAAHTAGLSANDVLVAIGGLRVPPQGPDSLLRARRAGETVSVHVFRRDELRCFDVVLPAPGPDRAQLQRA